VVVTTGAISHLTDFHKIQWKGGTSDTEETIRHCGNPDHIR